MARKWIEKATLHDLDFSYLVLISFEIHMYKSPDVVQDILIKSIQDVSVDYLGDTCQI